MMWKWNAWEGEMEEHVGIGGLRLRDGSGNKEKEYDA